VSKKTPLHYPILSELITNQHIKTVVEIGVWRGEMSRYMFENCPSIKTYIGIDPYKHWSPSQYKDGKNRHSQKKFDRIYSSVKKMYHSHEGATLIRDTSIGAVNKIDQIDMVFIDGNHGYEYVKSDIQNYTPKVRNGGIVSGHDYSLTFPGVIRAVNEFCHPLGITLHLTPGYVWYFVNERGE